MSELPEVLRGTITPFAGNGRKLGYPTANIRAQTDLDDGVYFGWASIEHQQRLPALIFVGTPTTVGDAERRVEAHVLDIKDVDYYGKTLKLEVSYFFRANKHFATIDELKVAMHNDEQAGRNWFANQT